MESLPIQTFGDYGEGDMFDVRAQFDGRCRHRFAALEDTLCQLISRPDFLAAVRPASRHRPLLHATLAERQQEQEAQPARATEPGGVHPDADRPRHLQPALQLDNQTSLLAATEAMVARGTDCLLYPAADGSQSLATRKTLLHALTPRDCRSRRRSRC